MALTDKVIEALTTVVKLNNAISELTDDVKALSHEMREIDRRLVRLETYLEIAEKQKQFLSKNQETF